MKQTNEKKEKMAKSLVKIGPRLNKVMNTIFALMTAAVIIAVICFQLIGSNMTKFYNVQYQTTQKQMEIRRDVQTLNKRLLLTIIKNDASVTSTQKKAIQERFAKISEGVDLINENLDDADLNSRLKKAVSDFETGCNTLIQMVESGKTTEATNYYDNKFNDISEVLADALDETGTKSDAAAADQYRNSIIVQVVASITMILFGIGAIIVGKRGSKKVVNSIVGPLSEIEKASGELARGNLSAPIQYQSEDEIGQVAESLRTSLNKINSYIGMIDGAMSTMADGDFNVSFKEEFIGDFKNIESSIVSFTDKISDSMKQIETIAGQVSGGSTQIAAAGQSMAEGATDQAGIVEELSATVGSVSQTIEDNAKAAVQISEEVANMATGITEGNEKMKEVVAAMETITETSRQIGNIIDSINKIAAQTNLLALNASIEAARAGEAGKGFAVVADQVSELAKQSANAAASSTQYIDDTIRAVADAKEVADSAYQSLDKVAQNAGEITEKVTGIASASNDQAESVKQIDAGIEQIAQVVESNAAIAQENSASSEELTSEAQTLHDLMEQFNYKK